MGDLKAWNTFVGDSPMYDGCVLVYAETRNKARMLANDKVWGAFYTEVRARRVPHMDRFAEGDEPYCVIGNDDLPEGAPDFYRETV